jgi:GNAT superfamily N-acetyltransferase
MVLHLRSWHVDDHPALLWMVWDFLTAGIERGGDVLPTERNVNRLIQNGQRWADAGRPCLVATVDGGGTPVGYVEWGWDEPSPFDVRWRTCFAFGTYVMPRFRGQGVATTLRARARGMCTAAGIERIVGPVHLTNPAALSDLGGQGWWPTAVQMELLV